MTDTDFTFPDAPEGHYFEFETAYWQEAYYIDYAVALYEKRRGWWRRDRCVAVYYFTDRPQVLTDESVLEAAKKLLAEREQKLRRESQVARLVRAGQKQKDQA